MIERKDVMPIDFLKKEKFTGSFKGMRFCMEKAVRELESDTGEADAKKAETVLTVTAWPEPYGFVATPDEQKVSEIFSFSEQGIVDGVAWLNEQHPKFR